jgi:ubiquinol-cytochrome c reductase cytochrome b subunit
MPPWKIDLFGYELTLSVLIPAIVLPGVIVTALAIYPWIEQKITGTLGYQHMLDRPRTLPTRTGLGAAFMVFYLVLWIAGGNDLLAISFGVPVNWVTGFLQISVIVLPPLAYVITKRICLGLQRRDRDKLLHGRETGIIVVSPAGEFSEIHLPLSRYDAYALTSHERQAPLELGPEVDENGIPAPRRRWSKLRVRLSKVYFVDMIEQPTAEENRAGHHDLQRVSTALASPGCRKETQR